jgi:hypothetical protein
MGEKMTYKQALLRSLILGVTFSVITILSIFIYGMINNSNVHGRLYEYIVLMLNGCGAWLVMFCSFIGMGYRLFTITLYISPVFVCLLLGSVIFLPLKNKKWLTIRKFTFILVGMYLFINAISGILIYILAVLAMSEYLGTR